MSVAFNEIDQIKEAFSSYVISKLEIVSSFLAMAHEWWEGLIGVGTSYHSSKAMVELYQRLITPTQCLCIV